MNGRRRLRAADSAVLALLRAEHRPTRQAAGALSRVAHGGGIWWALSGVLAARPGRLRRAGVEGALAWTAASTASGAAKQVLRRRRPPARAVAGGAVHSWSMPSSHAATAAAFTVAAVAEAPVLVVPLAPLVGAIGWSRLAAGRHFPTDVAAGFVLGTAVGTGVALAARSRRRATPPGTGAMPDPATGSGPS